MSVGDVNTDGAKSSSGWLPPGPALLFCPADRPERFEKAAARADVVILDLEDGCAPDRRDLARAALVASNLDPDRVIVRVNPAGSVDQVADLAAVAQTRYRVLMLAKAETSSQVEALGQPTIALIETPLGALNAPEIARAKQCVGLVWGAEDLVAGLGGQSSRFPDGRYRDVAQHVRSSTLLAARAYGKFAIDAVHLDIEDQDGLRAEAEDAVALGFSGTTVIHPSQVKIVRAAYAPTAEQIAWAREILAAAAVNQGVFALHGQMVDAPVFRQAEAIMRRVNGPQ